MYAAARPEAPTVEVGGSGGYGRMGLRSTDRSTGKRLAVRLDHAVFSGWCDVSGVQAGGSRPPQTNSTDPRRTRITNREGVKLRAEVENASVDRGATAETWSTAVSRWRSYIEKTRETSLRFDQVGGEATVYQQSTHRWSPDYQEQQYARMKDMERGIEDFYEEIWTGMVTLTASSDGIAPVDHLHELLDGREKALAALRRALDGRTWDYWWVLEPHESGYLHLHLAVVVEGPVRESTLRPAVEAHLRHCGPAGREAHADAVDVRPGREISNVAAYLNAYVGEYGESPLDAPEHVRAFNSITWATGSRETGASRRLRKMMKAGGEIEEAAEEEWELTAVVDDDGEHPIDKEAPGGVRTFQTEIRYPRHTPPD